MRVLRLLVVLVFVAALGLGASSAYTVRTGDTLSGIATRLRVEVRDLALANGITDPNRVVTGRNLVVPAAVAAAPKSGTTGTRRFPSRLLQSPHRLALVPVFQRWAAANAIPADLLMATTWLESGWQNQVVSRVGAIGIGQLMPATVRFIRTDLIGEPTLDPRRPDENIRMSARYLHWLIVQARGDLRLALGGYYQGPRSIRTIGAYDDTVAYVDSVLALRHRFTT